MLAGKNNITTIEDMARAGGKARAKKLSAKRRSEIAQKAARARWGKKKGKERK